MTVGRRPNWQRRNPGAHFAASSLTLWFQGEAASLKRQAVCGLEGGAGGAYSPESEKRRYMVRGGMPSIRAALSLLPAQR